MDRRMIPSDKNTTSARQKRLVIVLEQTFGVIERQEHGRSNSKTGRDVGMPESTVRNVVKHGM
jgi:hypothetical protein